MSSLKIKKSYWYTLIGGTTIGLVASFIQTIERIHYAKNPTVPLTCDVSSIFSCSNVFDAWQSSVFGFSNSLLCIVFFAVVLGAALAGAGGARLSRLLRLVLHFFTFFFLCFGTWYLWQSTFRIGYICIFCVFCYIGVVLMNWAFLRINVYAGDLPMSRQIRAKVSEHMQKGTDTILWLAWILLVAGVIVSRFW